MRHGKFETVMKVKHMLIKMEKELSLQIEGPEVCIPLCLKIENEYQSLLL